MCEEITVIGKSLRCILPKWCGAECSALNMFCEKIIESAEEYVKSDSFPKGATYSVRYDKTELEKSRLVIYLSLRKATGDVTVKKVTAHLRHGLIVKMSCVDK